MKAYSLTTIGGFAYSSTGIYTSLDKIYCLLRYVVKEYTSIFHFSQEEIKSYYKLQEVYLDSELEICKYGNNIEIDWEKVFKNS